MLGMKYKEDTSEFYKDIPEPVAELSSVETRVAALEEALLVLLYGGERQCPILF
jgi:hypothetical protein